MSKRKRERYQKVVEYEEYEWQKGELDWSHLVCFLGGLYITLVFVGMGLKNLVLIYSSTISLVILYILSTMDKRKVYWEKVN